MEFTVGQDVWAAVLGNNKLFKTKITRTKIKKEDSMLVSVSGKPIVYVDISHCLHFKSINNNKHEEPYDSSLLFRSRFEYLVLKKLGML